MKDIHWIFWGLLVPFFLLSEVPAFCISRGMPISEQRSSHYRAPGCKMSTPKHSAVVFDIDGTLCDSFNLGFSATNTVLKSNGHPLATVEDYHFGTRYTTPVRLARHAGLDPDRDGERFRALGAALGKEFDDLYIGMVSTETAPLFDGVKDLIIDAARGGKVGALSNAAVAYVRAVLQVHDLAEYFRVVHGADDVPCPKPAPDGLVLCCQELGHSPKHVVYVGDSPSDGIAARAAGMQSIGVTWGSHKKETLDPAFDVVVDTMDELRKLLLEESNIL